MRDERIGIEWDVRFKCDDADWLSAHMGEAVDALSTLAVWNDLQVIGEPEKRGKPFKAVAEVKKALKLGRTTMLAHGDRDATLSYDRSPVSMTLEPMRGGFAIALTIKGEPLERLGPDALDEVARALAALIVKWRSDAPVWTAWCTPFSSTPLRYPRARPVRLTEPDRSMAAIVDILDPRSTAGEDSEAARALAKAPLPQAASRSEIDDVVIISWCRDPRDRAAVIAGAAAHHAWLLGVLPSTIDPYWTEVGDKRVDGTYHREEPPFVKILVDEQWKPPRYVAVVELPTAHPDGETWARVSLAAKHRTLSDGTEVEEVDLQVPTRADVNTLRARAQTAGFDRVVYKGNDGALWDPDPPPWQSAS